jgi:ABC-2 type transport system permease protein
MRAWQITRKDLKLLLRDRRALAVLVVLPLIFITIIGLTTGRLMGWAEENKLLQIGVIDDIDYDAIGSVEFFEDVLGGEWEEDPEADGVAMDEEEEEDGDFEEEPVEEWDDDEKERGRKTAGNMFAKLFNRLQALDGVEVLQFADLETARNLIHDSKLNVALVVGKDFYQRVDKVRHTDILNRRKGRLSTGLASLDMTLESGHQDSTTHSVIEHLIWAESLATISPQVLCRNNIIRRQTRETCDEFDREVEGDPISLLPPLPIKIVESEVYQQLIPSYTVMFVFFLVNIMARSFIHERDLGTLRRLRIAPLRPAALLVGKTVPFLVISLMQTALLFGSGKLLFGMSWGPNPWLLLPLIFCTSLSATTLGLMVATLVRTEAQVSAIANLVVITMAGISGCFMPRKWLPEVMQEISLATPHAWSLIAYDKLLSQQVDDAAVVMTSCTWLLLFAFAYFLVGSLRFARID